MRTTIDGAGRLVVPKALRDAMGLAAGRTVDMIFTDGRIEIELAPVDAEVLEDERLPRLVTTEPVPELTDTEVRDALDGVRR